MKKIFFTGTFVAALFISGCSSSAPIKAEKSITKEENIKIYKAEDTSTKNLPLKINGNSVVSEDFIMNISFNKDEIELTIKNISKNTIFVNWSSAKYVGFNGKEQKLFNMDQKDKGFFYKPLDYGLRAGETTSAKLVPIDNLKVLFGSSSASQEIFINSSLFSNENKSREYAEIIIPIVLNPKNKTTIVTDIYFGTSENGLKSIPIKNRNKQTVVVKQSSELKKIKTENETLIDEIENKDEIIKELQEKVRLKMELEKKELEIQELKKKLNIK